MSAMSALLRNMPAPRNQTFEQEAAEVSEPVRAGPSKASNENIPKYGQRNHFIPRRLEDFGDGGAFPECHVAQYPLNMGRKGGQNKATTLATSTDGEGKVSLDVVVKQGHSEGTIVHTSLNDMKPKRFNQEDLVKPSDDEVREQTEKTRSALEALVGGANSTGRIASQVPQNNREASFIRYTPQQTTGNMGSGAQQRVVKMVNAQIDPLEPPQFKHKKVPGAGGSPPAPVLHSPSRKLTADDIADWKIPPCVSQWKNNKGYTIPLDKRLAADGRGAQTVEISDNFAALSEALLVAQESAREAIEARARERQDALRREKEVHDELLRKKAQEARLGRAGVMPMAGGRGEEGDNSGVMPASGAGGAGMGQEEETAEERAARREREDIRYDRRRERERERRHEELERAGAKRSRITRDKDRDVSERIALGLAKPTGAQEMQYDQRLFNQSSGMDSGFGAEDNYNLYDKPLFSGSSANALYKPSTKQADEEVYGGDNVDDILNKARFKVDNAFKGAEEQTTSRSGPMQFQRGHQDDLSARAPQAEGGEGQASSSGAGAEEDMFGIGGFFSDASNTKNALDTIGSRGSMAAQGESAFRDGGSSMTNRQKIDFESQKK